MGRMGTRAVLAGLAACCWLAAPAQATVTLSFEGSFTTPTPASPTGLHLIAGYQEEGVPGSKPSNPPRSFIFTPPSGTAWDQGAAPQCAASADEIVASRGAACPAASKIGDGSAQFVTGFGPSIDPVPEHVDVFNATTGVALLFFPTGAIGQTMVVPGTFTPDSLSLALPPLCLPGGVPPDCANGEAVPTHLDVTIAQVLTPEGRTYVRTPANCEVGGWLMSAASFLKDGAGLFATSRSACTSPAPPPPPEPLVKPGACANERTGTAGADALRGSAAGDRLRGLGGDDVLTGLGGADCLHGGPGNDRLAGSAGPDVLAGDAGADALSGGAGVDRLVGGKGRDSFAAGAGADSIDSRDRRRETVNCGRGRDTVRADRADRLVGCERKRR